MSKLDPRTAWTLLLASFGAIALIAARPAGADAQPLPGSAGGSGSGMAWGSSSSTTIGPRGRTPYGWLSPGSPHWPEAWWSPDDYSWPDDWSNPCPGLFGDTALSVSNSFRFGVSDFSIVEMPEMIQPPPAEGWEPNREGGASSVPTVEPPEPMPTQSRVRAPLNVAISPERPAAEPQVSGPQR